MSDIQLSKQDKEKFDAVLKEWQEKVEEIRQYEERNPDGKSVCLDGGYNGPYTELDKIYKLKLDKILGRNDQKEDIPKKPVKKNFSDMTISIPEFLKK